MASEVREEGEVCDSIKPPVTEAEVQKSISSTSELKELAARFNPPVNMKKTTGKKDMGRRLLLAIQKFKNLMKDINLLEQIFIESQQTDDTSRKALAHYFEVFQKTLREMKEGYSLLHLPENTMEMIDTHRERLSHRGCPIVVAVFQKTLREMKEGYSLLHLPENTMEMIDTHRERLSHRGCPIVVAGEVSSGKSTLLNLFLGESKLPVSVLGCTGRVCELAYGETPSAKLVTSEKQEINIDTEKLDEFINMQGKDTSFNKFDIVKLFVKVPFLKSGITLIDTPGIGHDYADSSIVKEYVKGNDVFGFIFTIQSVAGGGVNQQFRNLLHTLAGEDYKDKNGNPKLDPTAVMFVCNYWDSVPENEKEVTKKYIIDTITQMPFMVGFKPEKQIFYLDSKGAYSAYEAGYITEDYDLVIDGMSEFFKVGQMRKLEQSYLWIETTLQRCLHSLRSFLCWASQQRKLAASNVEALHLDLDGFQCMSDKQLRTFAELIEIHVENVRTNLQQFLELPETKKTMGIWTKDDMKGVMKYADIKEIFEFMLDQMIDERISEVLLKWEMKYRKIGDTQAHFAEAVYQTFRIFNQRLNVLERDLHCVDSTESGEGDAQSRLEEMGQALDAVKRFVVSINPGEKTDFKMNYSVMHGHDIINGKGFQVGKKIKTFFRKKDVHIVPNRYSSTFQKDLLQHMEYRIKTFVERLCTEEHTRIIVREQFAPINTFFKEKASSFKMRLNQNMALVRNLSKNVDFVVGTNKWYETYTESLKDLFDNVLSFSFKYMTPQNYEDTELIPYDASGKSKSKLMDGGIYGQIELAHLKNSDTKITVKYLQDTRGNLMRESEVYNLVFILGSVKMGLKNRTPVYLGTCYRKCALVFEGHLHTVRSYFLAQSSPVAQSICEKMTHQFIQELGDALYFIHLEKLVHVEVSADSILVKQEGASVVPMLSVLSEKKDVDLPSDGSHIPANNFIYLPPEVLHREDDEGLNSWYRSTGDVYGLGLLMVELFYKRPDVFLEKKQTSLKQWMEVEDTGTELVNWVIAKEKNDPPQEWKKMVLKCLAVDPHKRMSVKKFNEKLKELTQMNPKAKRTKSTKSTKGSEPSLNMRSEKVIAPHLEEGERATFQHVKKLAVKGASNTSEESIPESPSSPVSIESIVFLEDKATSLSVVTREAPDYALYNTGIAMRAATATLDSNDAEFSVKDIVKVLGSCKPRYSTFPLVGINEALRHRHVKTQLLWCELPQIAGSSQLKDMTIEERMLQEAMFEIISSEASYQRSIEQIVTEIIPHVNLHFKDNIGPQDLKNLFSNIAVISEVSNCFYTSLDKAWDANCRIDVERLCDVVTEFLSNQANRDAYIIYFSNFSHQRKQLQILLARQANTGFPEYVKSIGHNNFSLMDGFLCLPIQRIPRYKILIDAVIKNLKDSVYNGPVGEKLQTCLYEAKTFTQLCDDAVKTMQDMEYMVELDRKMDFGNMKKIPVASQSHLVKRHGAVGRICPRLLYYPWPYKEKWEIHCFTDYVFFCAVSESRLLVKMYCPTDKLLASAIRPETAKALNGHELPEGCEHLLHVKTGAEEAVGEEKDMLFSCIDESELLRWVEVLCPHLSPLKPGARGLNQPGDTPLVIVMRPFRSKDAGEMSLYEGEIIKIIKKIPYTDWTFGEKAREDKRGWFPMSHTKEIECLQKKKEMLEQEENILEKTKGMIATRCPVRSYDMDDLLRLTSAISSQDKPC